MAPKILKFDAKKKKYIYIYIYIYFPDWSFWKLKAFQALKWWKCYLYIPWPFGASLSKNIMPSDEFFRDFLQSDDEKAMHNGCQTVSRNSPTCWQECGTQHCFLEWTNGVPDSNIAIFIHRCPRDLSRLLIVSERLWRRWSRQRGLICFTGKFCCGGVCISVHEEIHM